MDYQWPGYQIGQIFGVGALPDTVYPDTYEVGRMLNLKAGRIPDIGNILSLEWVNTSINRHLCFMIIISNVCSNLSNPTFIQQKIKKILDMQIFENHAFIFMIYRDRISVLK